MDSSCPQTDSSDDSSEGGTPPGGSPVRKDRDKHPRLAPGTPPGGLQDHPFVIDCPSGKYAYCLCQQSARFPYCDGTHVGSGKKPLKVIFDEPRRVAWCACGKSAGKPYCDGSHTTAGNS